MKIWSKIIKSIIIKITKQGNRQKECKGTKQFDD